MRTVSLLSFVAMIALAPVAARAEEDASTRAKERFAAAAQAYREARYKDAIDLFLQANKLEPHPELVFNVGQAYEKLGDVPNALRSYREYLRLSPGARDRATVEASIRNLETRLREKGVQQVSVFSTPAGAGVVLDQKSVGQTPWTGEIAPGRHVVVLRATGFPDTAKEFLLTGERAMDLDITLAAGGGVGATTLPSSLPAPDPIASPKSEPAREPAHEEASRPPARSVAPWTVAVLGVGVAGLGAALGFELARKSAENAASNDPTQLGYADHYDAMTGRQTAARVFLGVGAAATVAGVALLVVDLRGRSAAPARQASAGCFGAACGAFARGSF